MATKQIVVVEKGVEGIVLNPSAKDRKNGVKAEYSVPFKPVMKAARKTGIDRYIEQLENGKRLGMRGNNKVLAPVVRGLKPATPGTEVNNTSNGQPAKGSQEAKDKMARVRAARGKNTESNNTELVLSSKDAGKDASSSLDRAIANARDHAKETGDFELLTILLDRKYA